MREDAEHICKIIDKLNDEAYALSDGMRPFVFEDDGIGQAVKFFGISLWQSEEDEREDGEPLEPYLRYRADAYLEQIKLMTFQK